MRTPWNLLTLLLLIGTFWWPTQGFAQPNQVEVLKDRDGMRLAVDGEDMMVYGMNWGYIPIGENYAYDLWSKDEAFIQRVLDTEMALLEEMGVNTIRLFSDIPPKWVTYIYDNYGIMVAVNHLLGRYGFEVNGAMVPDTDYGNPATRTAILADVKAVVERYRNTRGVLMFLLGNENNYGLQWTSFDIEDVPGEVEDPRADQLYSLWCEAASVVSDTTPNHPVAIVNGDLQYLDLVARYCDDLDILGSNMYRGASAGDAFQRVRDELGIPFMYTEFGSDAYNARTQKEDDQMQARYLKAQWREIYHQSYAKGAVGNAIGGMIFQWSDGWWKYKQETNLSVHDTTAQWSTGAYDDYDEDRNNMNEEWWGITAKNPSDPTGFYTVTPRTAYYVLREAFELDPYATLPTRAEIDAHFDAIGIQELSSAYRAAKATSELEFLRSLRVSGARLYFDSSVSQGTENTVRGDDLRSGHTESFYTEFSFEQGSVVRGRMVLQGVGNVASNRLDDIFYEQRALADAGVEGPIDEPADVVDRFAIYEAEFEVRQPLFELDGFYRVGHEGWGYEGDFFNLYPEAYYGPNLDIYNGQGPLGMEFTGRRQLDGLKLAAGPQLWWGANPAVVGKYHKDHGWLRYALIHHEDLTQRRETASSFAIPAQLNRRTSLHLGSRIGKWDLELGGLWSGTPRIGERFLYVRETDGPAYADSDYEVFEDEVTMADTFGGRARATLKIPGFLAYGQGSLMGLVADGGYNYTDVVTGWQLKESGRGNHWGASGGFSKRLGNFEVAPKALYQKPLIAANPTIEDRFVDGPGLYFPPVSPRNILDNPFAVLENRETLAGELLLVWDPTPGTWWHRWDRETSENAPFGASLDVWYQHLPGRRDSHVFTTDSGDIVPFGAAPEPADEWLATLTGINNFNSRTRMATSVFVGRRQPQSDETRAPDDLAVGAAVRFWWRNYHIASRAAFNEWGPYDFFRDFNLVYPFQYYLDASWGTKPAGPELGGTRIGARGQVRTLDERSLDYLVDAGGSNPLGVEWEIGIYANIAIGGTTP